MTSVGLTPGDRVHVACPACATGEPSEHEVLKPDGQSTVRCTACGHVHKARIEDDETREDTRIVVSSDGESMRTTAPVPADERIAVGEEFVAETEAGPMGVRITSLERREGERVEHCPGGDVETIWTRAVDNVGVPTTVHPQDGRREGTTSETYYLPGDEELVVGETIPLSENGIRIERLLLRDDVVADGPDNLDERDDGALAKDVKRAFGRRTDADTWRSPWD